MPWNPEVYNTFKNIRFQPFFDLAAFIQEVPNMKAIDLGCGTGEQTAILVDQFKTVDFMGVDTSPEMLQKSQTLENERLHFRLASTEQIVDEKKSWDLIFSNAALQWSDQHRILFPQLIALLNPDGQFAVQMPYQPENILNKILFQLAEQPPYKEQLNYWNRPSSVLTIDDYAQILFENGLQDLHISQKVYPIIAPDSETLFDFISGSALIPYLERLDAAQQTQFTMAFKEKIKEHFRVFPAIYAFKRILLYGRKSNASS